MFFQLNCFILLILSIVYILYKSDHFKLEKFVLDNSPCDTNKDSIACKEYICSARRKQCYIDCFNSNCSGENDELQTTNSTCKTCPDDVNVGEECANCIKICDATFILCKNEAKEEEIKQMAEVSKNKEIEKNITLYYCGEDNMTQNVLNAKFDYNFINPISNISDYKGKVQEIREIIYGKVGDINESNKLDIFLDEIIKKNGQDPDTNFEKLYITYIEWRNDKDKNLPKVDGYFKNIYIDNNQIVKDNQIFSLFQKLIYKLLYIRNAYIELYPNEKDSVTTKLTTELNM